MSQRHSSAVVLGAGMSGLLAARALSGHVARVTLVERDALPERDESRKGVPQSNHAHGLLASGYQAMDEYFPGMMDELGALGAPRGDVVGDFLWFQYALAGSGSSTAISSACTRWHRPTRSCAGSSSTC